MFYVLAGLLGAGAFALTFVGLNWNAKKKATKKPAGSPRQIAAPEKTPASTALRALAAGEVRSLTALAAAIERLEADLSRTSTGFWYRGKRKTLARGIAERLAKIKAIAAGIDPDTIPDGVRQYLKL